MKTYKNMKHDIGLTILLILCISCKSYQKKSHIEQNHNTTLDSSALFQYRYREQISNNFGRMWYFHTDSSFRYHPDSGIDAGSGLLWLVEKGEKRMEADRLLEQEEQYKSIEENREQHTNKQLFKPPSFYWVILLLAGGGLLFWIRKKL